MAALGSPKKAWPVLDIVRAGSPWLSRASSHKSAGIPAGSGRADKMEADRSIRAALQASRSHHGLPTAVASVQVITCILNDPSSKCLR
jgi:hypothetical protein